MMVPRLIISADDFGLTPGVNQAVRELAAVGTITATNVMVNMPYADQISFVAAEYPRLSIGIHINLTQGRPVLPPEQVSSLVDENGVFHPRRELTRRAMLGRVSHKECAREISAQVARLTELIGDRVDHWNSHEGIHRYNPVTSAAMRACRSAAIQGMRTHRHLFLGNGGGLSWHQRLSGLLKERYYQWLSWRAQRYFCMPDAIVARRGASSLDVIFWIIEKTLPEGVWEIVCHPATTVDGLWGTTMVETRVLEFEWLASKEFRSAVLSSRVELLSFSELCNL